MESQQTDAERTALDVARQVTGVSYSEYCENILKTGFAVYNGRYSRFSKTGGAAERFRAWKRHIVEQSKRGLQYCALDLPFMNYIDLFYWGDLIYCGHFSRDPETLVEHGRVQALSEIIDYAKLGKLEPSSTLLVLNGPDGHVQLNPDVEYYLRRLFKKLGEYRSKWDTAHLESVLSPQRKAFVEAAVTREDFAAVLDTTPLCKVSRAEVAQ